MIKKKKKKKNRDTIKKNQERGLSYNSSEVR